jgi:phosphatidylinositol alpha-1,6-mannosyltransferase
MGHLLVTNDFPPKIGGIQTYLWELWRRLPPGEATVVTASHPHATAWDRDQPFDIVRLPNRVLLPRGWVTQAVNRIAQERGADLVVVDPALPLGLLGAGLELPYAIVAHGAEITVPGRLPASKAALAKVAGGARGVIAAGCYPAAELARLARTDTVVIPPGVDSTRFHPLDPGARTDVRRRLGLPVDGPLVLSASRLVPRKGMDTLIEAASHLLPHHTDLVLAIAGGGRDASRLRILAGRLGVKVHLLGRISDTDLADLYGAADVFVMLCRDRWAGLEQEGFGIVFLEAAAAGVPQVAGASGGAQEAVVDGVTGVVIGDPNDPTLAATEIARLLDDPDRRAAMGHAARARAQAEFDWDLLAGRLFDALKRWES